MSTRSVFCIASSRDQAERIVGKLKSAHFSKSELSVLFADKGASQDFDHGHHTLAAADAADGAGKRGVISGALGWIAGIGPLAIPGAGPYIAAGPIVAALGAVSVGAAVGVVAGGLMGLGVPEIEAWRYDCKLKGGSILLAVHEENSGAIAQAREICIMAGGQYLCSTMEAEATPWYRRAAYSARELAAMNN